MNKIEFMRQLESLLQNISEQERQEALHYYTDYFDDAGPENEQAVIEALGNPARVAENIRRDLYGAGYGDGYVTRKPVTGRELTEYGTTVEEEQRQEDIRQTATTQSARSEEPVYAGASAADTWQGNPQYSPVWENAGQGASGQGGESGKKPLSTGMIILIVILCIFGSPVIAGLLGGAVGILGGLLGLIVAWFAMILGFGIAALVCVVVGLIVSIIGAAGLGIRPLAGLALIGGGFITVGSGILFLILTVFMAGVVTPAICRGIAHLFSRKKA